MRSHWLVAALTCVLGACASSSPVATNAPEIEVALSTGGATQERVVATAKAWLTRTFRSALENEQAADGKLTARASIPYPCSGADCSSKNDWLVPFTMQLDTQGSSTRLVFQDVHLAWPERSYRPAYEGVLHPYGNWDAVKARLLELGADLQRAIVEGK